MKKVELLAPAKNYDTAIAAINSGADAVYIGAVAFGARYNAANSLNDIERIVNYAHKFYVKVHVTLNTILNNKELEQAAELIHKLYNIGVDAIIIQDMGILQLAIENKLPPIQIHISTQCNNKDLEKVKFFDKLGISRVILARELSVEQIKEICSNVSCEIETFIHGALCVSYSGQCYLSLANGGRSANRGECAQPCRKKYNLTDDKGNIILKDKYLLSLKDFNASEYLKELISIGVKSFKIEGRLKDINYVKNIVLYYNNLLASYASRTSSGRVFSNFEPNPEKTFNRGYTNYFLQQRNKCYNFNSPKYMGEKLGVVKQVGKDYFVTDAAINPQDGLCFILNNKIYGFPVNKIIGNKVFPNKMKNIQTGTVLYRNFDSSFDKKLNNTPISRKIGVSICINNSKIFAKDEDNNEVNIKLPDGEIPINPQNNRKNYDKQLNKLGDSDFYILDYSVKQDILPFLPVSKINNLRRELLQLLMKERLRNYKKLVQKPIHYSIFPQKNINYKANVFNNKAEIFYNNCDCKVCEQALENLTIIPKGVELMRTKHCLRYSSGLCLKNNTKAEQSLFLEDETGTKYPLKFDCKNCEMVILQP